MKKKFLTFIFTIVLVFGLMPAIYLYADTLAVVPNGTGAIDNPYQITESGNLIWISNNNSTQNGFAGKYFMQTGEISMSGVTNLVPIGDAANKFNGIYNGNGNIISDLTMDGTSTQLDFFALFGYIGSNGIVKNIIIENANISGAGKVGTIFGILSGCNEGIIKSCKVTEADAGVAILTSNKSNVMGAISGKNMGFIAKCSNQADVTGSFGFVGGIVGENYGYISDCINDGDILGYSSNAVGGIAADEEYGHLQNCINTGTITVQDTSSGIGAIIGLLGDGNPSNNYYLDNATFAIIDDRTGQGANSNTGCTAKSAADLKTQAKYAGLDFANNWSIVGDNYPEPRAAIAADEIDASVSAGTALNTSKITINDILGEGQTLYIAKLHNSPINIDKGDAMLANAEEYTSGNDTNMYDNEGKNYYSYIAVMFVNQLGNIESNKLIQIDESDINTVQPSSTGIAASDNTPTFTTNPGQAIPVAIDPNLIVTSDSDIDGARVYIDEGFVPSEDSLIYDNDTVGGIIGNYNDQTGVLTLTGVASAADYQTALRNVKYCNSNGISANLSNRTIVFSIGQSLYYGGTGHYYEYVSAPGTTWADANTAASASSFNGLNGYLATITSEGENEFIREKCAGNTWLGASDAETEGIWKWVTGPESGTLIGTSAGAGQFALQEGMYANWHSGEPNNAGNEDYAHIYSDSGTWNDFSGTNPNVDGYLIEYGGGTFGDTSDIHLSMTKTITMQQYIPSANANLNSLTLSSGTLSPDFVQDTTSYKVNVAISVDSITVTPTRAESHATIKVNGTDVTSGDASNSVALNVGENTITVVVTAENGETTKTYTLVVTRRARSGGGNNNPPSVTPPSPPTTNVDVIVNGENQNAGTQTTTNENGISVTTIAVDESKIEQKLNQEGNNSTVVIPVNNSTGVVVGQLSGQTVKNMEQKEAVLEIKTANVLYTLPASEINIDDVSSQIGQQVKLKDIKVNVQIAQSSTETSNIVEDTAHKNNYQVVVKPVDFEITCASGSKTVDVSEFNGYVERQIAIPDGIDPSKITTGIVLNRDGTFSHVPTIVTKIDGKYYARINSLTNSTYSVIYSTKSFKDVENHWAKADINDMASRLIIDGVSENSFAPDKDISRAEFVATVVRGLGLMRSGTGKDVFKDVNKNDWYYDAVSTAYEYKLIYGVDDNNFAPQRKITREEAMAIIARAMALTKLDTKLSITDITNEINKFADKNNISDYAKASIAACVKNEIVVGNDKKIMAKDKITRAETATIIKRLLQKSKLI